MFIPLHDANSLKHIRLQYVTLSLIAINVVIWLITGSSEITDIEMKQASFAAYGFIPAVANGYQLLPAELERVPATFTYLTYSFFHGDFMHLAGNMLFIWVFGDNVEDAMGHLRFLGFYLASAAAAALAHSLVDPSSTVPLIGASGAASGIVAAYLFLHPNVRVWVLALGRIPLPIPASIVLGGWAAFQVYQFFTDTESQVSWAAHIGGLIAGSILILFLRRDGVELFDRNSGKSKKGESPPSQEFSTTKMEGTGGVEPSLFDASVSGPPARRQRIQWGRQTDKDQS